MLVEMVCLPSGRPSGPLCSCSWAQVHTCMEAYLCIWVVCMDVHVLLFIIMHMQRTRGTRATGNESKKKH